MPPPDLLPGEPRLLDYGMAMPPARSAKPSGLSSRKLPCLSAGSVGARCHCHRQGTRRGDGLAEQGGPGWDSADTGMTGPGRHSGLRTSIPPQPRLLSSQKIESRNSLRLLLKRAGYVAESRGPYRPSLWRETVLPPRREWCSNQRPAVERSLLEHGSCHFDQIIGWGAADLDWIELKVSFAGRVGR